MSSYKNKLDSLANKLKSEDVKIPIQEVSPVKTSGVAKKEEEAQLNVWIPKSLLKKVKGYALEEELSLKEITIKALEEFLK
ncbi:hypothetical protein [Desertivirga arenae]|uniref:hypothetical protein n=1 Tax=Desertivirga arenae TaxID=2810309 RepID=UPI001A96A229|nr:hypothetical protein [Pedobacter sp. SYSU D00823]